MLSWLNENSGFVEAMAAVTTMAVALAAIISSHRQARRATEAAEEARRDAQRSAELIARTQGGALLTIPPPVIPSNEGRLYFDVRNVGRTGATLQSVRAYLGPDELVVLDPPLHIPAPGAGQDVERFGARIAALVPDRTMLTVASTRLTISYVDAVGPHEASATFPPRIVG